MKNFFEFQIRDFTDLEGEAVKVNEEEEEKQNFMFNQRTLTGTFKSNFHESFEDSSNDII